MPFTDEDIATDQKISQLLGLPQDTNGPGSQTLSDSDKDALILQGLTNQKSMASPPEQAALEATGALDKDQPVSVKATPSTISRHLLFAARKSQASLTPEQQNDIALTAQTAAESNPTNEGGSVTVPPSQPKGLFSFRKVSPNPVVQNGEATLFNQFGQPVTDLGPATVKETGKPPGTTPEQQEKFANQKYNQILNQADKEAKILNSIRFKDALLVKDPDTGSWGPNPQAAQFYQDTVKQKIQKRLLSDPDLLKRYGIENADQTKTMNGVTYFQMGKKPNGEPLWLK